MVKKSYGNLNLPMEYQDIFEAMMKGINNNVYFKDKDCRFFYVSKAQLKGFNEKRLEDIIGKTDFDYFSKEVARETYKDEQKIMKTGEPMISKEERLDWANGETTWCNVSKYPLYDHKGVLIGTWGISTNITNQKKVEFQLEEQNKKQEESRVYYQTQSETDEMTNLYNQRKFYDEASSAYKGLCNCSQKEENFCIAFLDIDNFKKVNDEFGHLFGDFLLKEIALIIRDAVRTYDIAFRYGGDEFLILYKGVKKDIAKSITNRIREQVESRIFTNNECSFKATISAGIASSTERKDVKGLMKLADTRLYKAKSSGKNIIV